ncbi:MAG: hypothetical protein KA185_16765 [Vitreoscilla sp.]|jgi:hypothetical protein|nr:hypothetical protein [Vitreoscilla sp.]
MRQYPKNSPQAAARIVALTLLSDGYAGKAELDMLDKLGAPDQLGLTRAELHAVVHAFCEDLLCSVNASWIEASRVDERTLGTMLAEVDDPALRDRVLHLCVGVVEADCHVAAGESTVLMAAVDQWGLHHALLQRPAAATPA